MPAKSDKQANAAKLAGAVKKGEFPKSKAGKAVTSMSKMPMSKLKHFMKKECLESMTTEQKRKLLIALKKVRGGKKEVTEYGVDTERNVTAKTFETKGDFDSYVNQHRGIAMTDKEKQAIVGYKNAKPTQQDNYFVRYDKTDAFGTNDSVVIKKLMEGQQFCWTAFAKHSKAESEGKPDDSLDEQDEQQPQAAEQPEQNQSSDEVTVSDSIRITKTITFKDDTEGSNILGDFLRTLDI